MIEVLFVITAVCSLLFFLKTLTVMTGASMDLPLPFGHMVGVSYANTYIWSSSLVFQVWFWANYFNIFG